MTNLECRDIADEILDIIESLDLDLNQSIDQSILRDIIIRVVYDRSKP